MGRTRVAATLVVLAVYVALPTKNFYWDGVSFAQTIESASRWAELVHPNHLVYNFLGYGIYHLMGAHLRALYVLQAIDAVFAAATVYLLLGIIRELGHSEWATLLFAGLFAFSGTWWRFATDADAYVPSVFFLMLTARWLLPSKEARPARVAISHAAAMLFHQLAVFFFPAALVALWGQRGEDEQRQRALRTVEYAALSVTLTLMAYLLGFIAQGKIARGSGFWPWITSHSPDSRFSFAVARDVVISLRSWIQLFLIGRLMLVRFTNPWSVALVLLAGAVAVLSVVDLFRHGLPHSISIRHPVLLRWALVWLGTYALFLLVWLPHNTFYKLFALPAIILLVASCTAPASERSAPRSLTWLVAMLSTSNLAFGIVPYSRIDANGAVAFAVRLRESLPTGAVVYYWKFNTDDSFARYFNPQTRWQPALGPGLIDADLSRGKSVWLETTATDHFAQWAPAWFAARSVNAQWVELLNYQHRIRFVKLHLPKEAGRRVVSDYFRPSAPAPRKFFALGPRPLNLHSLPAILLIESPRGSSPIEAYETPCRSRENLSLPGPPEEAGPGDLLCHLSLQCEVPDLLLLGGAEPARRPDLG